MFKYFQGAANISLFLKLKNLIRRYRRKQLNSKLPLKGFDSSFSRTSLIDSISDEDLIELNKILEWNCFTSDNNGRRFGSVAWGNKRISPEPIPDSRISAMHKRFNLTGKHVLEVGCFEGVHTIGLFQYTDTVTAIDSRIDHVIKTIVRCAMYGYAPRAFKYDVESDGLNLELLNGDLLHHVGVLYHLRDPVSHLLNIGSYIKQGLMLDTHYALPEELTGSYDIHGCNYRYKHYLEYGKKEAFSGMYDHSKWLLLDDIVNCLKLSGFDKVEVIETRSERNGPRVLMFAERT